MEAKTQKEAIKKHLIGYGHITSVDAYNAYGITRLSAIIFLLREEGLLIETLRKQVVGKFGNKGSQAIYNLIDD